MEIRGAKDKPLTGKNEKKEEKNKEKKLKKLFQLSAGHSYRAQSST